jgi:single-stranded-DNA-specific exonuclease
MPAAAWESFREEAHAAFRACRYDDEWRPEIEVDTVLEPREADLALAKSLEGLEPHGMGNPRPVFLVAGLAWDGRGRPVGEKGLRFAFESGWGRIEAVGWSLAEIPRLERAGTFDVVANLAHDAFTGGPSLTVLGMERAG